MVWQSSQLVPLEIRDELGPELFGLAHDHGVAVLLGFLRQAGDVHPSHDDRDAALAEMIGDFVAAEHAGGDGGDADQVGLFDATRCED